MPKSEPIKRTGLYIKQYLEQHGRASISEMHQAYSEKIREENSTRRQQGRRDLLRKPTYHSFYAYFRNIVALQLVELVAEVADAVVPEGLILIDSKDGEKIVRPGGIRRLWALTAKGNSAITEWINPRLARYS